MQGLSFICVLDRALGPESRSAAAGPLNYLQITGGRIISLGGVLILSYGALIKTFFLCKDIP